MKFMPRVPESPEVIEQAARHLHALYLRVWRGDTTVHRDALTREMTWLCAVPSRALRVAMILGVATVYPMRHQFDLDDPEAGLYFSSDSGADPEPGEAAAAVFLNHVLRYDYDAACETFGDLVTDEAASEIRNFLGLVLAVASI